MENKNDNNVSLPVPPFSVEDMHVWPIDPLMLDTHSSLEDFKDKFRMQSDFAYYSHVALDAVHVYFTAMNDYMKRELPAEIDIDSEVSTRLLATLSDSEGAVISECEFPVTLPICEEALVSRPIRLVFPFQYDTDYAKRTYKVEIKDKPTSLKLAEQTFTVYDYDQFVKPVQIYRARRAAIFKKGKPFNPYVTVASRMLKDATLHIDFLTSEPENMLPEMDVTITGPRNDFHCCVRPVADEMQDYYNPDPFDHPFPVSIDIPFPEDMIAEGEFVVKVMTFNHWVSYFTINIGKRSRKGYLGPDEIDFLAVLDQEDTDGGCGGSGTPSSSTDSDDEFSRLLDDFIQEQLKNPDSEEDDTPDDEPVDELKDAASRQKLDSLVGMNKVKQRIDAFCKMAIFNKRRVDAGCSATQMPLHTVFLGSPGTGKTTVATMLGRLLKEAGVLSSGHVVVRERANLLGQNYNSESENTLKALEEAEGGILFIDEAYQLYQPNDLRDPGKFVLETLMTALSDEKRRNWMLILSGYAGPMEKMLRMNIGLSSRIPECNRLVFDDYSLDELMQISERFLEKNQFFFSEEARDRFAGRVKADYEQRDECFGNARHVQMIIETEILPAMAIRTAAIADPTKEQLSRILVEDIPVSRAIEPPRKRPIGFMS